ncbi:hypothetical protein AMTRI_Chr13g82470 [Amborella trichopoda]
MGEMRWVWVVGVVVGVYVGMDPFNHSLIAGFENEMEVKEVKVGEWGKRVRARDHANRLVKAELLHGVVGPESLAFDVEGRGPYTGLADGRIVRLHPPPFTSFSDFAVTSPHWSKERCSGAKEDEEVCGRPLGLRFHNRTGELYIADAYYGLLVVGPEGGLARQISTLPDDGIPLRFTNDLDINPQTDMVYFTDSSSKFRRKNYMQVVVSTEDSGRLLKYDPTTKKTNVLLNHLHFPNGLSLSHDASFLVFAETTKAMLSRYWLEGEKAGSKEVFVRLPGLPDNVRANEKGELWVAIHRRCSLLIYFLAKHVRLRRLLLRFPVPPLFQRWFIYNNKFGGGGMAVKYSPHGELKEVLEDGGGKRVASISEAHERDGKLWIGSVLSTHVAVYQLEDDRTSSIPTPM